MPLTAEHRRRIQQALAETQALLDRELRYAPEHHNVELVRFCEQHIALLNAMLER